MVGYSREELLRMNIRQLEAQPAPQETKAAIEAPSARKAERFETRHRCKDGRTIDLDVSLAIMQPEDRPLVAAFVRDITQQKKVEQALRRRDAILEAVNFAAERFLQAETWEVHIQVVLERLGQAAQASRAYLFENHLGADGALLSSLRYEWVAPGMRPQVEDTALQGMPYQESGFGR